MKLTRFNRLLRDVVMGATTLVMVAASACQSFAGGGSSSSSQSDDGGSRQSPGDATTDDVVSVAPSDGGGGVPLNDGAAPDGPAPSGRLYAFVTINSFADVNTAAEADSKCIGEAAGRAAGKFIAWFPDGATSALERLVSQKNSQALEGPWFRLDDQRIVANRNALANAALTPLENPIAIDAAKQPVGASAVWTGMFANGSKGNVCPGADPTKGTANSKDGRWTNETAFVATCNSSLRLYCFQVE